MCWTMSTAALRPVGSCGTRSARARGPPVEAATATASVARPRKASSGGWTTGAGGRAMTLTCDTSAASARRTAAINSGASAASAARPDAVGGGLATISTAPSSNARIAVAVPGPAWALTTTMGRGDSDMMYPIAPRPSSSGISRSSVTTSGSYWWTLRTASTPSRAVATTRNGPDSASPPPSTSTSTRRIRALSSATRMVGRASDDFCIRSHRPDLHPAVLHVEPDAAAALAPHGLSDDRDGRSAQGVPGRHDLALPHLDRARGHELAEHAGAPGELGDQPPRLRSQCFEAVDQQGHRRFGELGQVRRVVGEAARRQQDVRHRPGPPLRVVQHDRDARAPPERHDHAVALLGGPVGDLDDDFLHAGFR